MSQCGLFDFSLSGLSRSLNLGIFFPHVGDIFSSSSSLNFPPFSLSLFSFSTRLNGNSGLLVHLVRFSLTSHSWTICFLSALLSLPACVFWGTLPLYLLHLVRCCPSVWLFLCLWSVTFCILSRVILFGQFFIYFVWLWWHFLSSGSSGAQAILLSISLSFNEIIYVHFSNLFSGDILSCSFRNTFLFSMFLFASQLCFYALHKELSSPFQDPPCPLVVSLSSVLCVTC